MPKRHQQRPSKERVGRNNPEKSTAIPTGAYKKQATYRAQAATHQDPGAQPPLAKPPVSWTRNPGMTHQQDSRARAMDRSPRSGSNSNAHSSRKASQLHAGAVSEPQKHPSDRKAQYAHDLSVAQRPAQELGLGEAEQPGLGYSAYELKEMHTRLADLTDDELKRVQFLPTGTRLEQGAKYIDLNRLERGEIVADAGMIASPENYYVAKKTTDYVLWNRLNQVDNPARLDEP